MPSLVWSLQLISTPFSLITKESDDRRQKPNILPSLTHYWTYTKLPSHRFQNRSTLNRLKALHLVMFPFISTVQLSTWHQFYGRAQVTPGCFFFSQSGFPHLLGTPMRSRTACPEEASASFPPAILHFLSTVDADIDIEQGTILCWLI